MSVVELMYCDADHGEMCVDYYDVHVADGFADPNRTPDSWVEVKTPRDLYGFRVYDRAHYCPSCAPDVEPQR